MVVDDEEEVRDALANELSFQFEVESYGSASDALHRLQETRFDALISDVRMPGTGGVALIQTAAQLDPAMVRIFLTGHADLEITGAALSVGAYKLRKPWGEELLILLHNALVHRDLELRMRTELNAYVSVTGPQPADRIVSRDEVYRQLRQTLEALEWVTEVRIWQPPDLRVVRWSEACPPRRQGDSMQQRSVLGDHCVLVRWHDVGAHCTNLVDIALRRATDALQMRELADEIRKRAEAMERIRDEIARRDRLAVMGAMVASVAHDIRNPLFALRCNLPLLEETLQELEVVDEEIESICEDNQLAVETIHRVVQSMERVAARPDVAEDVDVQKTVALCARLLKRRFMEAGIELEIDIPSRLLVEATTGELCQIVINLLTNGLQASPRESVIALKARKDGPEVRIVVHDEGPGVAKDDREEIFAPFLTTKPGGMGIGLSIAREMARRHGGDLAVRDSPKGACFELRLPAVA